MTPPYKSRPYVSQIWRERNRPKRKPLEVHRALAAHDRIQRISDEIRARHGLEPVAENSVVIGWRCVR